MRDRVFHRRSSTGGATIAAQTRTRLRREATDHAPKVPQGEKMKATVTIHVETLWTNRAELTVEAELDNPNSGTNQEVISMMFEAAQLMTTEARGENERALFSQSAMNRRYRELDERDARLDERDKRLTAREEIVAERDQRADECEDAADTRERDEMERALRSQRHT